MAVLLDAHLPGLVIGRVRGYIVYAALTLSTEGTIMGRLSLSDVALDHGFGDVDEMAEALVLESVVPACCEEGCEVEPDGRCEHGHPSIFLAMGVI